MAARRNETRSYQILWNKRICQGPFRSGKWFGLLPAGLDLAQYDLDRPTYLFPISLITTTKLLYRFFFLIYKNGSPTFDMVLLKYNYYSTLVIFKILISNFSWGDGNKVEEDKHKQ